MHYLDRFDAMRAVSTPFIAIDTMDQPATVTTLTDRLLAGDTPEDAPDKDAAGKKKKRRVTPIFEWDLIRGLRGRTKIAAEALGVVLQDMGQVEDPDRPDTKTPLPQSATTNLVLSLEIFGRMPERTVLFVYNAHNYLTDSRTEANEATIGTSQALMNLRDANIKTLRLVILCGSAYRFPPELRTDIQLLDEPLPSDEDLRTVVEREVSFFNEGTKDPIVVEPPRIVEAVTRLRGIGSVSAAKQTVAMSLSKRGLDLEELWSRNQELISRTPGLKVYTGRDTYDDLWGYDEAKEYYDLVINGLDAPEVFIFQDEIEKMFTADTSGTTTEMLGMILTEMEDEGYIGGINLGPPGCGKSAFAKALAGRAGKKLIYQNLQGAKSRYVGDSTANLRAQFKVIRSVSRGRACFLATCNSIASIPPELRRRYNLGTYFFDLPEAAARPGIWQMYMRKFEIHEQEMPNDHEWTGSDIFNCVRNAYRLKIPLVRAAKYVIPVMVSARTAITKLRVDSSGKYLDASREGLYQFAETPRKKVKNDADTDTPDGRLRDDG